MAKYKRPGSDSREDSGAKYQRNLESPTDQKFATMASLLKSSTLSVISVVVLVLYSAGSPASTCAATSVPPNLMTGLNLGKLSTVSKWLLYYNINTTV